MTLLNLTSKTLNQIAEITGKSEKNFHFLGYSLNLQTGDLQDIIQQNTVPFETKDSTMYEQLSEILTKYAHSAITNKPVKASKLVNLKDFSGGYAYENAFYHRVVETVVKLFGNCPSELILVTTILCGKILKYGDYSVELETLPGIPLTFILWTATTEDENDERLPPSVKVLFDESAGKFLNVEDISWISDFSVWRMSIAQKSLKGKY
ncbi:MAG: DUF3786 domain-containing protein [Nitrososphaerota archaeon]|jgi:hypothetical protein|nr:DUF3786 domain-containing protein [Nitrososphaerota archaeon]